MKLSLKNFINFFLLPYLIYGTGSRKNLMAEFDEATENILIKRSVGGDKKKVKKIIVRKKALDILLKEYLCGKGIFYKK
jgi:hypothetical protein